MAASWPQVSRGRLFALRVIEARAIARPPTTSRVDEITPPCRNLADRIADRLGPHVEPWSRRLEVERIDPKTEHTIERDNLFEGPPEFRLNGLNIPLAAHIYNPDRGSPTTPHTKDSGCFPSSAILRGMRRGVG